MKKIQMVDLQSQYQKIKSEIDSAIIDVIENKCNDEEVDTNGDKITPCKDWSKLLGICNRKTRRYRVR